MTKSSTKRIALASCLLCVLGSMSRDADAAPLPSPQWLESGMNLLWAQDMRWHLEDGGFGTVYYEPLYFDAGIGPVLTVGVGRDWDYVTPQWALQNPPWTDWYALQGWPVPLTGSTPLDGGSQYFCYVVNGNAATDGGFNPNNYSFVCSLTQPYMDLSPSAALTANGVFTVNEWDAGFVGSMFYQIDGGWQPWFRNGQQVVFDMPQQVPQTLNDGGLTSMTPLVDSSYFISEVEFTPTSSHTQTILLPPIVAAGDVIELQIANNVPYPPTGGTAGPASIQILDPDAGSIIGEATVGPVNLSPVGVAGEPRLASYRIEMNAGSPNNYAITLGMSTLPGAGSAVSINVVLHGYHEPIK